MKRVYDKIDKGDPPNIKCGNDILLMRWLI